MQLKLYDKPFVCDKLSLSTSLSAKLQFFLHKFNMKSYHCLNLSSVCVGGYSDTVEICLSVVAKFSLYDGFYYKQCFR